MRTRATLLAFAFALALAAPAAAQAASVELRSDSVTSAAELIVSDAEGEVNRQTLSFARGASERYTIATVRDDSAALLALGNCTAVDAHTVTCEAPGTWGAIWGALVELGAGDDTATVEVERARDWQEIRIHGGPGNDRISSPGRLEGEAGNDRLTGANSSDILYGGPGADIIEAGAGYDSLQGGAGNDVLRGGSEADSLDGGAYGFGGDAGRDRLYGGDGGDYFEDGDGNLGVGPDLIDGGEGGDSDIDNADTVGSYVGRRAAVRVDLADSRVSGQKGEADVLRNIESVYGGRGDDVLRGTSEPNELIGNRGKDSIRARDGADRISFDGADRVHAGGHGDTLTGAPSSNARLVCGKGRDSVEVGLDERVPSRPHRGPLVAGDCERFGGIDQDGEVVIQVSPKPAWSSRVRRLRFRVFDFNCCDARATLSQPASPFSRIAGEAVTADPLTLRLPRKVNLRARRRPIALRMSIARLGGEVPGDARLVWRFRVG